MKRFVALVALAAISSTGASANDLLRGLISSQRDGARSSDGVTPGQGTPTRVQTPSVPSVTSSASTANCPSSGQTTIPLNFVSAMLRTKGASLQLMHDPAQSRLNVRGGDFLANCNGMLEWGLRTPTTDFPQYVVELKIKSCGSESCEYTVMEKNDAGEQVEKKITVKPDFSGFQQCLKDTGVMKDNGSVDAAKMVIRDLDVSFDGVETSGNVWFGSHLPLASAVYKKQAENGCYYLEDVRQGGFAVYSSEDSERMRLDEQAQLICESGNYRHIADFLDRYGQYSVTLGAIRDELILKDYKDLAEKIRKGDKLETLDYSVIGDFQRYIVDPLTTRIADLHQRIGGLPNGAERRAREEELRGLMRQLASYRSSPFVSPADLDKLMAKGLFDEAEQVNVVHLTAHHYGRLGATDGGVLVTPRVVRERISADKQRFQQNLVARKEQYNIKTGRVTGRSDEYASLAAQHRRNIEIRTRNFQAEINEEAARITQPNGYCFKYFRNTQRCVQDSLQRIQELRSVLQQYNNADAKIASDLEEKARMYRGWEQEGERYIARQNGSEEEREPSREERQQTSRSPSVEAPRADRSGEEQQNGPYTFQFNNPQQQMPTQMPNMPGQQMNPWMQQPAQQFQNQMWGAPWGQFQQQSPFMHQQQPMGWGMQNGGQGYTFNFNNSMAQRNPMMFQGNNMWGQQTVPYQWGAGGMGYQPPMGMQGGFGFQAGMGVQPWMGTSPMSYNMGAGMQHWR